MQWKPHEWKPSGGHKVSKRLMFYWWCAAPTLWSSSLRAGAAFCSSPRRRRHLSLTFPACTVALMANGGRWCGQKQHQCCKWKRANGWVCVCAMCSLASEEIRSRVLVNNPPPCAQCVRTGTFLPPPLLHSEHSVTSWKQFCFNYDTQSQGSWLVENAFCCVSKTPFLKNKSMFIYLFSESSQHHLPEHLLMSHEQMPGRMVQATLNTYGNPGDFVWLICLDAKTQLQKQAGTGGASTIRQQLQ